ncbi:MAG: GTP-binding protein [Anaerolineaceae bacterium]|nr:GTP-binding protein [Anaerolineaceae bacterium]
MNQFESFVRGLPEETRQSLFQVWDDLPPAEKSNLRELVNGMPSEQKLARMLISMSLTQFKYAFGDKHSVAIIGPTNVGKSTLYNQFIRSKEDNAATSPVPGTTHENQKADAGLFAIIDTPGADAIGSIGEQERDMAYLAAKNADFIILVFDAIQGVKQTEKELYEKVKTYKKPFIVVLNKTDIVKKELTAVLQQAAVNLGINTDQIIPLSAKTGDNLAKVLTAIVAAEPRMISALGKAMPAYRWQLAWRSIIGAASMCGVIALTPLPIVDFIPLVTTQAIMVGSIARIYNYKINLKRGRELVTTFGVGYLGRTLFYELSKFGGLPGWVLSAMIAASTTIALGYASAIWFERGERLTTESVRNITKQMTQSLMSAFRSRDKSVKKRNMRDILRDMMENMPYGQNRELLDEAAEHTAQASHEIDLE